MASIRFWCVLWLASLLLVGCGIVTTTKPGEHRTELEAGLSAVKDSGQSAELKTLTDFEWDEVHVFREYTPRAEVEEAVGQAVIDGDSVSSGGLLVFENRGDIVKTVYVRGDYLRADHPSWDSTVILEPWGAGFLRLTDAV